MEQSRLCCLIQDYQKVEVSEALRFRATYVGLFVLPCRTGREAISEAGSPWLLWVVMKRTGPGEAVSMASRVPGSGWTMPFSSEAPTAEPMTAMTRSMEAARAWGVSRENGIDSVRIQSERVGGIMAVGSDSSINYLLPSCVGLLFTAAKIPFQLCPLSEPISAERKKFFSLPIFEKVLWWLGYSTYHQNMPNRLRKPILIEAEIMPEICATGWQVMELHLNNQLKGKYTH